MRPIRFAFDEEKFVQALAFLAEKRLPQLTTLKVAKLLFLADKKHFTTYGRPILGDQYVGMKNGPCPSRALNLMNLAVKGEGARPIGAPVPPAKGLIDEFLKVDRSQGKNPVFVAHRKPDLSVFSRSELKILDEVIAEHGKKTGRKLVDETHEDRAYAIAWGRRGSAVSAEMPYELFFEGASAGVMRVKKLVEVEQEDRDFVPAR